MDPSSPLPPASNGGDGSTTDYLSPTNAAPRGTTHDGTTSNGASSGGGAPSPDGGARRLSGMLANGAANTLGLRKKRSSMSDLDAVGGANNNGNRNDVAVSLKEGPNIISGPITAKRGGMKAGSRIHFEDHTTNTIGNGNANHHHSINVGDGDVSGNSYATPHRNGKPLYGGTASSVAAEVGSTCTREGYADNLGSPLTANENAPLFHRHHNGGDDPHHEHSARGLRPSLLATAAEIAGAEHDASLAADPHSDIEIFVYTRRWIILAIFVAALFINQAQFTAYVTIVDETRAYYNISAMQVNLLAIIYTAINAVMIVFVCYFYDKVGFRNGVLLVCGTNLLCAGCKFLSVFYPHYAWLVVGQIFGGCSQVLAISIPPLLASIWFPLEERSLATALGSVSGNLGVAFSFWASPMILNNTPDKEHFLILMTVYFAAAVVVLVLSFFLVHDQPPKPPSVTARTHDSFGATSFVELLQLFKKQLMNSSLMRLCIGFGICVGLGSALSNVLTQIYKPFGVDNQDVGIIGAVSIIATVITTPFAAMVLDRFRAYKPMLLLIYLLTGVVLAILAGIMKADVPHLLPALYVLLIGYQVVSQPSVPLMMEFSVEKTYPDPEFISSSFCLLTVSVLASIGGVAYSALLGDDPTKEDGIWCVGGNAALSIIAIAITATVTPERLRYEEEQRIYKSARVSQYNVGDMPADKKKSFKH